MTAGRGAQLWQHHPGFPNGSSQPPYTSRPLKIGISARPRHVSKNSIYRGSNVFDSIEVGLQLETSNDGADDTALNALSSAVDRGGVLGAEEDDDVRDLLRVGEAA